MKFRLLAVGKIRERYVRDAVADFSRRLARYHAFEEHEIAASFGGDANRAMREEGDRIIRTLEPSEPFWLLERGGIQLSSLALSAKITALADAGAARLTIAIAGPYGSSAKLIERADFCWSLSELTFLHEWARAIAVEQLYRAAKIARNEPYHH